MTLPRYYALRRYWRRAAQAITPQADMGALIALLGGPGPIR